MLPVHSEIYLAGKDTLFEKLKGNPAMLNLVYGEKAEQNMAFPTNSDGIRLLSIDYTFSNINTMLGKNRQCEFYDETTGMCGAKMNTTSGDNLGTLEEIKEYDSNILLPTFMPNFALFDYLMNSPPAIVEEPYIFARNVKTTEYYYYSNFSKSIGKSDECGSMSLYTICRSGVDFETKFTLLQSPDKYLLISNIPVDSFEGKTLLVGNNKAFFTKSQNSSTLRWSYGQNYFILIFTTSAHNPKKVSFDESTMKQIAESMTFASDINANPPNTFVDDYDFSCKLVCGDLCYNQDYLQCIDGVAQSISYTKSNSVWFSEVDKNKSYLINSDSKRTFEIHNNYPSDLNIGLIVYFYPKAPHESADSFAKEIVVLYGDIGLGNEKILTLKNGESKKFDINFPTNNISLGASIVIAPYNYDNRNCGVGGVFNSAPFSIYDPNRPPIEDCHGYKTNTPGWGIALCTSDLYVPLGGIGCNKKNPCQNGSACIAHHCFQATSLDKKPTDINMLLATIYLQNDDAVINRTDSAIQNEVEKLKSKLDSIKLSVGIPQPTLVTKIKCSATPAEIKNLIDSGLPENYNIRIDALLQLCKIQNTNWTHRYIAFPTETLTDTDRNYVGNFMGNISANGLYVGQGDMLGGIQKEMLYNNEIGTQFWNIMLHEMMHSFGAPDLYLGDGVYGVTYLWGGCSLMKANRIDLNYTLCPLELSYLKN